MVDSGKKLFLDGYEIVYDLSSIGLDGEIVWCSSSSLLFFSGGCIDLHALNLDFLTQYKNPFVICATDYYSSEPVTYSVNNSIDEFLDILEKILISTNP